MDEAELDVIAAHIDARRAVIGTKVRGDGGQIGRQIAKGLDILVERHVD